MNNHIDHQDAGQLYFAALNSRTAGNLADAELLCRKSIALAPNKLSPRVVLGEILLAQGNYIEGFDYFDTWPELQAALGLGEIPTLPFPKWNGEDLTGKSLLVLPLQGYGDQIQYARFFNHLSALGAEVTAVVPPALSGLFEPLKAHIFPSVNGLRIPKHDYWTYPISIPRWLRVTPESIDGTPYLRPKMSKGSKIGVAWRGSPSHPNDANRSANREDFRQIYDNFEVVELGLEISDSRTFLQTADILEECEAVVAVDTSVVHLAGAIGCPCHVLLPAIDPDWRWMNGPKVHWYNSVSIERQDNAGDWSGPIERVIRSLREQ